MPSEIRVRALICKVRGPTKILNKFGHHGLRCVCVGGGGGEGGGGGVKVS